MRLKLFHFKTLFCRGQGSNQNQGGRNNNQGGNGGNQRPPANGNTNGNNNGNNNGNPDLYLTWRKVVG